MRPEELDAFAARYFEDWRAMPGTRAQRVEAADANHPSAGDVLDDLLLSRGRPEDAWPLVLALIERAPDDEALAYVAAGPLEDLVRHYPQTFADRLVENTRRDPRFRAALAGVWGLGDLPEPLRGQLLTLLAPATGVMARGRKHHRQPSK